MSVYFGNKKVSPLIVQSKQQTNTEVQLALAGGNQDIIAPNGYLYYKVTIIKPATLVSNNIRKGVTIAGVIGTMEERKEEEEKTINITANNTYTVIPTEGKTLSKVTAVVTVSPTLQSKSVTPSTSQQIVTSDDGYQGLSQVIVYKAPTETIEITPTKEVQTKQPSDGKVGYSEVTVKPIPDNYIIPSGTLEITGNGTYDVSGKASANVNVLSEKPTLNAPTISLNGATLTITNPATNGNFVTAYKVYDGATLVTTVTTTTVDLSTLITTAGTHIITVKASGTNFNDSVASNSVVYTILGLETPVISLVSGTTIQIDTIDDNATTIEVFADGLSIGEVQKQ